MAVLDRDGWDNETDVLVVVDRARRRLLWVPRDLWCDTLGDRVNTAFRRGGHDLLGAALAEHDLDVEGSLVLRRSAVERGLAAVSVTVPVPQRLEFWYPTEPTSRIEEGRKRVVFEPPAEALSGERVHQWLGARTQVRGAGSDLYRIGRQQVFLGVLLATCFDFSLFLVDPSRVAESASGVRDSLREVDSTWSLETLTGMAPARIDGKQVLVMRGRRGPAWWLGQRTAGAVRRWLR